MSKAGERLLQGAREALEFANGTANPDLYRFITLMSEIKMTLRKTCHQVPTSRTPQPIPH